MSDKLPEVEAEHGLEGDEQLAVKDRKSFQLLRKSRNWEYTKIKTNAFDVRTG